MEALPGVGQTVTVPWKDLSSVLKVVGRIFTLQCYINWLYARTIANGSVETDYLNLLLLQFTLGKVHWRQVW